MPAAERQARSADRGCSIAHRPTARRRSAASGSKSGSCGAEIHLAAGQRGRGWSGATSGRSRRARRAPDRRGSAGRTAARAASCRPAASRAPVQPARSPSHAGRRASGTMRYSVSVWLSWIGSQRCGNRLTIGVQPSASASRPRPCAPVRAGRGRDRRRSRAGCRRDSSVLPSSRVKSTNRNFSGKAKYSVSSRNPAKLRAGQGSSASSGREAGRLDRVRRQESPVRDRTDRRHRRPRRYARQSNS